jgi:hypothetical protein
LTPCQAQDIDSIQSATSVGKPLLRSTALPF